MAKKVPAIGNEVIAGSHKLEPRQINQSVLHSYHALHKQRNLLIYRTSIPPRLPLPVPARMAHSTVENPTFNNIAYTLFLVAGMAAIAAGTPYINWAFLVYGLFTIAARIQSNLIFIAALISLVLIPIASGLQRGGLADNFGVMTFYFLLIGLIRASLELRRENIEAVKALKPRKKKAGRGTIHRPGKRTRRV